MRTKDFTINDFEIANGGSTIDVWVGDDKKPTRFIKQYSNEWWEAGNPDGFRFSDQQIYRCAAINGYSDINLK